nr:MULTISPECIES: hypothetical protein [Vibrio]
MVVTVLCGSLVVALSAP